MRISLAPTSRFLSRYWWIVKAFRRVLVDKRTRALPVGASSRMGFFPSTASMPCKNTSTPMSFLSRHSRENADSLLKERAKRGKLFRPTLLLREGTWFPELRHSNVRQSGTPGVTLFVRFARRWIVRAMSSSSSRMCSSAASGGSASG